MSQSGSGRRPSRPGSPGLALLAGVAVTLAAGALCAAPASAAPPKKPACVTGAYKGAAWKSVKGGNVRIHYRRGADARAARRLLGEVTGTIWPKFLKLLQRPPLSDAKVSCYHGPDGRFDIYLTPDLRLPDGKKAPADTKAYVYGFRRGETCGRRPTFAVARPGVSRSILAHELYHAFQGAYDRKDAEECFYYSYWDEATANWGMQFAYPDDQVELLHPKGIRYPRAPFVIQGYDGWVLPYFMEKKLTPDVMRLREFWSERIADPDKAFDRAIPGGFPAVFPEFALHGWNQAPIGQSRIRDSFREWDALDVVPMNGEKADQPIVPERLGIAAGHLQRHPLPVNLRILEREYRRFTFDSKVRRIRFDNTLASAPNSAVGAFVKVRGEAEWRVEDWSRRTEVEFCRDRRGEDVEELVLVFSNPTVDSRLTGERAFVLEDSCALHYKVLSSTFSTHADGRGPSILCGTVSGTRDFAGASSAPWFSEENKLDVKSDGTLDGWVGDFPTSQWTNQVSNGCRLSPSKAQCTYKAPNTTPQPDGTWQIGFSVEIAPGASEARLNWAIPSPSIGYVDAGDDECHAYVWGAVPQALEITHLPVQTFLGKAPFEVTHNGVAAVPAIGLLGGSLDYSWSYRLTLQRVDAGGNPLP